MTLNYREKDPSSTLPGRAVTPTMRNFKKKKKQKTFLGDNCSTLSPKRFFLMPTCTLNYFKCCGTQIKWAWVLPAKVKTKRWPML